VIIIREVVKNQLKQTLSIRKAYLFERPFYQTCAVNEVKNLSLY